MGLLSWEDYKGGRRSPAPEKTENENEPVSPNGTRVSVCKRINEATQDDLLAIKGIGPKTCEKILQSRPFNHLNDLESIGLSPRAVGSLTNWTSS